jgi:CHASE2 domain-containing sensor protein
LGLRIKGRWKSALVGAIVTALLGLIFASASLLGLFWQNLSFDLPFVVQPKVSLKEVGIIVMDEGSMNGLRQQYGKVWDRALHANLLNYLKADGAKMVVFDVNFDKPVDPPTDQLLAEAIRAHEKVVLAGVIEDTAQFGPLPKAPLDLFRTNAAGWGVTTVENDGYAVVRRHHPGLSFKPSLAWAAAAIADAPVTRNATEETRMNVERWLRYYGPPGIIPQTRYIDATNQFSGFFSNRVIFIGSKNRPGTVGERKDEFASPYLRWNGRSCSGVEIIATTYLNLVRGDWLTWMPRGYEALTILVAGLVFGFGLRLLGPVSGVGVALLSMVAVAAIACWIVWTYFIWFSWAVIAGAQIPCAYLCALIAQARVGTRERVVSSADATTEVATKQLSIPHHRLLYEVGRGGYGRVWLVENAVGLFAAAKIVSREFFESDSSYEREFRGLQNYMPLSSSHPGLLQITFVGREDKQGYFFYLMEPADDQVQGAKIDSQHYTPRTLASDLRKRGHIPPLECVGMMVPLTEALQYLHSQERIHRDIKPSNIVFVRGQPKFADIGLVTRLGGTTYAGTEGYVPPEGPNTISADIYALGMVIYGACVGLTPDRFPEFPTDGWNLPSMQELFRIITKACALDKENRYPSALALRADLETLQQRLMS